MPRQSRIDAPGAVHHVIVRGIERRKIFKDDLDRQWFLGRLGAILIDTNTPCYAWALIPNHFHLLLRTGSMPIATVMRRLLTGYAVYFNRRYRRSGHLFQNRYKSILCQEDAYLLELVRYIHLNPLRAKLAPNFDALQSFSFSGHSALSGKVARSWQDTDFILGLFGATVKKARLEYLRYVDAGICLGRRADLTGGGLIRSQGGWEAVKEQRRTKAYQKGDERILGDGDFVEKILRDSEEVLRKPFFLAAQGMDFEKAVVRVAELLGMAQAEVLSKGKKKQSVHARSLLCFLASEELGITQAALVRKLAISQGAVSAAVERGRKLAAEGKYSLVCG